MIEPAQIQTHALRFDRTRIALERLSGTQSAVLSSELEPTIPFAPGSVVSIRVISRIPAERGGGYLVALHDRTIVLHLQADYATGQEVRLVIHEPLRSVSELRSAYTAPSVVAGGVRLDATARNITSQISESAVPPSGGTFSIEPQDISLDRPVSGESLHRALEHSGLFYESHLAEWVRGERRIDELRLEPQGRLSLLDTESAGSTIPDTLLPVVNEQLHAIDLGRLAWHGTVWPHQSAGITLQEEPPSSHEPDGLGTWTTVLTIELPSLGTVRTAIRIQGATVRLDLTASADALELLRDRLPSLTESLAGLGLKLAKNHKENVRSRRGAARATWLPVPCKYNVAPDIDTTGGKTAAVEIIRQALVAGLYVHKSPELVAVLMRVDMDRCAPSALFLAAAAYFAWVREADVFRCHTNAPHRRLA